ncbi:MAG: LD-carboxypeptidase [Candidatus Aminicenantia bacterium]
MMKKPKALKMGDTIGIFAPGSPVKKEIFEQGLAELEKLGYKYKYSQNIFLKEKFLAGTDEIRAKNFIDLLKDKEIKVLIGARGGYGSIRMISYLENSNFDFNQPKILVGSSDLTVLLLYFLQKHKWIIFYGPMVSSAIAFKQYDKKSFIHSLCSSSPLSPLITGKVIKPGKAQGILTGGCLSLIVSTLGTPYEINTNGKILMLEDYQEKPYKIDRYLMHLKLADKFSKVKGIVFGEMKECVQHPDQGYELEDIIEEFFKEYSFPILFGFPFGHSENTFTLPLGIKAELDSDLPGLIFLEGATK